MSSRFSGKFKGRQGRHRDGETDQYDDSDEIVRKNLRLALRRFEVGRWTCCLPDRLPHLQSRRARQRHRTFPRNVATWVFDTQGQTEKSRILVSKRGRRSICIGRFLVAVAWRRLARQTLVVGASIPRGHIFSL
jgi:hypothetical protein